MKIIMEIIMEMKFKHTTKIIASSSNLCFLDPSLPNFLPFVFTSLNSAFIIFIQY